MYQSLCPSSKICFAGGFTQLVVYRYTGPRVSWQGELEEAEVAGLLSSFGSFFKLLYRSGIAPAGEVLARDVALFLGGGGLLLLASHSPFTPPQAAQRPPPPPLHGDILQALPVARSIQLHVVRLSDGVRLGGRSFEGELVDLGGRPGSLGISVHEDLVAVLAVRSQVVHLLQLLRGGEELVAVRSLGPHVQEDDELVLATAEQAEERWQRARRAEREASGRGAQPQPQPATGEQWAFAAQQPASGSAAAGAAPSAAAAVLYPPPSHRTSSPYGVPPYGSAAAAAAAAGGSMAAVQPHGSGHSGVGPPPADLAAAAAHQAAVRREREAMSFFRHMRTYESLLMRKVFLLDRHRLLIDMRTPAGADLGAGPQAHGAAAPPGGGPGMPPSQYFMLFDLQSTRVVSFKPSPGDKVIEAYVRKATCAGTQPWAEPLPAWDRYVFDNALREASRKLRHPGAAAAAGDPAANGAAAADGTSAPLPLDGPAAAGDRASSARKLMQLLPPVSGSCNLSSSPYLDSSLFHYDDRQMSPYIGTRPCMEQAISFRPRNRPEWVGFRLEPGPYQPVVSRGRRLARSVTHLFHPDAPFAMAVFSVFAQTSVNINFRI
ncbi:hypothetical protein GPECTOR_22g830 [Gonium pectorale]|uniref:Uncharacterized protein n=1 Tax=Gonium pectorale TaxID=33097 RepID=A0A150GHB8_GONPE|nr:hypothetical protein GPECTOR_22g830 [Gonium pectorale]|eukprot:KXZ49238.1 hypothetical protein GPECTOR_22g830 [Gonium pectorale]